MSKGDGWRGQPCCTNDRQATFGLRPRYVFQHARELHRPGGLQGTKTPPVIGGVGIDANFHTANLNVFISHLLSLTMACLAPNRDVFIRKIRNCCLFHFVHCSKRLRRSLFRCAIRNPWCGSSISHKQQSPVQSMLDSISLQHRFSVAPMKDWSKSVINSIN